jgi:hypothetical protein
LGVFLIWYSLSKLTPADIQSIKTSFKTANYWLVGLSLIFGVLSHLSRAYRWKFLLEPLGYKPRFANTIMAVLIAYLFNLFIPRSGEIARAASINKYENVPFEKAIGTIVAERVADVIMLFSITGVAFFLQTDLMASYLFKENKGGNIYLKIIFLVVLPLLGILAYYLFKRATHPFILKIVAFIKGLIDGIKSIITMKKKWEFIFHTVFIWLMYVLMFYTVTFALPETTNLPFTAIIVAFVVGGFSMALTNGGLGTYPVFVASALILYHIEDNPARAFGWIMWTTQTLMVIIFGGLSFLFIPIYNRLQHQ